MSETGKLVLRRVQSLRMSAVGSGPVSSLTPHLLAEFRPASRKDAPEMHIAELDRKLLTPNISGCSGVEIDVKLSQALRELKGVLSVVTSFQHVSRIFSTESTVYRCEYFSLAFYPPEHFLALARKSKPALHVTFSGGYVLNANLLESTMDIKSKLRLANSKQMQHRLQQLDKVIQQSGSRNPMDWAYERSKFRKFLREHFLRGLVAKHLYTSDGLYHFAVKVLPDSSNREHYIKHIYRAVTQQPSSLDWVGSANKRINIPSLNFLLKKNLLPYEYKFVKS